MVLKSKNFFLCIHSAVLKIRELSLIQHYCLIYRLDSDFANCPNSVLYSRSKSQVVPFIPLPHPFILFSLEQFLMAFLVF